MRHVTNVLKTGLSVSYIAVAACGGSGSSPSSTSGVLAEASVKAAAAGTASPSGTTIPSAAHITDGGANVWTVAAGVVRENGAAAGYSKAVTLLLYDNSIIYQENSAGGWWSWTDSTWASSTDPRKSPSANLTTIPAATQITDGGGNVWVVSGGVVYKNGVFAGYSSSVIELVYDKSVIYQENSSDKWWSWSGAGWTSSSDPVNVAGGPTISGSPATADVVGQAYSFVPTTTNPGGGGLSFAIAKMPDWAKFSTATGDLTGTPDAAQSGTYSNIVISVTSGGLSASLAAFAITVSEGAAQLSWTAPTKNTNGTALTDLSGYTISYGTNPDDLTETAQVSPADATSYTVSNLGSGTYYFAIAANATDGTHSAESAQGSKTIL
jgi:hypothetical protein